MSETPAATAPQPAADVPFVHLAVHSEYSLGDGLVKVKDLAARCVERGMPAVALTDRVNLFALIKFYAACRDAGIKPLIGVDMDYEDAEGAPCRCILLAASEAGYRNLLRLVSAAYVRSGDDARAGDAHGRVPRSALLDAADGLIALLGRGSDVGAAFGAGDRARRRLDDWRRAFGDRVYLEVVRTGRAGENRFVVDAAAFAAATGVPVVATNDVRFLAGDDFEAHETRVCIQEGRVLNDPRRERRYSPEQYLRAPDEMRALFADLPEALANAAEIARRCSCEIALGTYHLPNYPVPDGVTLDELLRRRAEESLARHLRSDGGLDAATYRKRLDYELGIITQMGFSGYFLIVQEFVVWAREHKVPVGCRGSGTASLTAFCLGITDLDPLRYGLIFERLLNPERVSMPDLDIDFCMDGREQVIAHVTERYGHDAVSQIVTFGTMAARLVVRDVARAQDKPFGLADRLSKMIPFEIGMTLAKAMQQEEELRTFVENNEDASEIMDMAYRLEGIVRNTGKHAGGVVIAPSALTDFVPLYADHAGGSVVSQFDLNDVESAGLVKFDFLGLRTLTIIDWAVDAINAQRAASGAAAADMVDIKALPLDDAKTFEFLKTAETTAVFQLESEGMKDLIRRLQPDSIDDIIALVALFRPGPLQSGAVDDYIDRKHGRKPVAYPHPALEGVLGSTYGVMLYQEQVMNMAQELAGFTLGQADLLRRAMAKKKPAEMVKVRALFLEGTGANGIDAKLANDIFDQVDKFAGYAFPKAHAASYGLLTFRTAWLKAHYPGPFMAAVLSADMQNIDNIVKLVDEVKRMDGVAVLPPDVNAGVYRFAASGGAIRYGLGAVRGVGRGPVEAIERARARGGPFSDLRDFCARIDARQVNKRVLEALIRAGALDALADPADDMQGTAEGAEEGSAEGTEQGSAAAETRGRGRNANGAGARSGAPADSGASRRAQRIRAQLLDDLADAMQEAEQAARDASLGIEDMFGGARETPAAPSRAAARPLTAEELLEGEKQTLGHYLTGHPLDGRFDEIRRFAPRSIGRLAPGRATVAAGIVISNRTRRSRRGPMAFAILDDRSGRIEVSLFSEVYEKYHAKVAKDAILVVQGDVHSDEYDGQLKLRAEAVMTLAEARNRYARGIDIRIAAEAGRGDLAARLRSVLDGHRSSSGCRIAIHYDCGAAQGRVALGGAWRVDASDALLGNLREAFGEGAVEVRYEG